MSAPVSPAPPICPGCGKPIVPGEGSCTLRARDKSVSIHNACWDKVIAAAFARLRHERVGVEKRGGKR